MAPRRWFGGSRGPGTGGPSPRQTARSPPAYTGRAAAVWGVDPRGGVGACGGRGPRREAGGVGGAQDGCGRAERPVTVFREDVRGVGGVPAEDDVGVPVPVEVADGNRFAVVAAGEKN